VRIDAAVWQAPTEAARQCADAGLMPEDVHQIECTLRDENGDVARNELVVSAEVEGGELLGVENGDLSDNTRYSAPERRTLDGRVVVFLRATGRASVRLSAPGLADVRVEVGA
jgi:hypothetical protein